MAAEPLASPILGRWQRLVRRPGGRWLFSRLIGWMAPYTATIRPRVAELRPGYARVELTERRRLRQHLGSVHAAALFNLGELATGLAVLSHLPPEARGIPTRLEIDYLKKARGRITAEAEAPPVTTTEERSYEVRGTLRDAAGDEVARLVAHWRVGPRR